MQEGLVPLAYVKGIWQKTEQPWFSRMSKYLNILERQS